MRTIVVSGFMATGKTTVGKLLAARLEVPFVDIDEEIARAQGAPVHTVFASRGEPAFRALEADVILPLLEDGQPRVLAFGGGAVTARRVRHAALDRALVVTLTAEVPTILSRAQAADLSTRPNLGTHDPATRARDLLETRAEVYAECHLSVATDGLEPHAVVDQIVPLLERAPLVMPLGGRTYTIDVVVDRPTAVTDAIAALAPSSLVVVTDSAVQRARGKALEAMLAPLATPRIAVTLPPGEAHKTLGSVGAIWDAALGAGVDRDAVILAFGGGVVGDLAGFAASTLLRGVRFVQVPTTLLSMVDSSVGGKTGFDHPAGKNLVGSFHQPSAVVADLAHLSTLSPRELRAGLAEVVKIAATTGRPALHDLEACATALASGDPAACAPIVAQAIAAKAHIVRDDERETGNRAVLNFGHTIGHALEAHGGYTRYLHGEAVALGSVLELQVGVRLGLTPRDLLDRVRDLLRRLSLPVEVASAELSAALRFVGSDKKRQGNVLRLPVAVGDGVFEIRRVPISELRDAALAGATS